MRSQLKTQYVSKPKQKTYSFDIDIQFNLFVLQNKMVQEIQIYNIAKWVVIGYSIAAWLTLTPLKLNYGRLSNSFLKIYIPAPFAWFLFEIPNLLWVLYFLIWTGDSLSLPYALFIIHYINRTIIYPLRLKTQTKVPIQIVLSAILFTTCNGYLQGYCNSKYKMTNWYLVGVVVFVIGMIINIKSDNILQKYKQKAQNNKDSTSKYLRIDDFLFSLVANPNYLGQIIQWLGYYIASGQTEPFLFMLSTLSILTPSSLVRNQWNINNIPNYPSHRKALIPYIL